MIVDRKPSDRYSSDREQANRSIRFQLDVILANLHHLRKVDKSGKKESSAREFDSMLKAGQDLTPGQRAYIDGIYEATMKGYGMPAVNLHIDKKRKGLRFE